MATYPSAGSSMLSTWNTSKEPINQSTYSGPNMSYAPISSQAPSSSSSYYYPAGAPNQSPYTTPTSGGSVLGASTGGNTGGGSTGGGQQSSANPYANLQPTGPSREEIDASFNPIFDVYNQAESNLRSQQPGLIGEAEAQARASQALLQNQRTGANELLGQQEQATQTQQARQSAQQRQTLQELQLANQQRFGGASSAGLGASEIQGREFQRSQFGIQENAQQALQAIGQQKQVIEREYSQGLQQLEVNKQQAINDINRRFQDKLLEINARRGETEAAKQQARMGALQDLRNQAFQINVSKAQFEADLRNQAQANSSYLSNLEQQYLGATGAGQQAVNQFGSTTPGSINSVGQSAQQTSGALTGQISGQRPEDLFGQVSSIPGSSATDPRFQNFQPFSSAS